MAISMRTYKVKVTVEADIHQIQEIRSVTWADLSEVTTRADRPHGTIVQEASQAFSLNYETDNPNTAIRVMGYIKANAEYRNCKVIGVSCEDTPKKWFSD